MADDVHLNTFQITHVLNDASVPVTLFFVYFLKLHVVADKLSLIVLAHMVEVGVSGMCSNNPFQFVVELVSKYNIQ